MVLGTSLKRMLRRHKKKGGTGGEAVVDDSTPHPRRPKPKHTTTATSSDLDQHYLDTHGALADPCVSSPEPSPSSPLPPPCGDSLGHLTASTLAVSPTEAGQDHSVVLLQYPTPSPQDDHTRALLGESTIHTRSGLSPSPRRALRDRIPIVDVLALESPAISDYQLPPPVLDDPSLSKSTPDPQDEHLGNLSPKVVQEKDKPDHLHNDPTHGSSPRLTNPPHKMPHSQHRRVWVKRPGASATTIAIRSDDLVDDVRDRVLQKYGNSIGRTFDSPDVILRIISKTDGSKQLAPDRMLGPEEEIGAILDSYYPGGQTVTEALLIETPARRTPKPSPRHHHSSSTTSYQALDEYRPHETATDYFPPMPPAVIHNVNGQTAITHDPRAVANILRLPEHARSISVLQTGQVPPLPSPGAASRRTRPKFSRQHTSSPTVIAHPSGSTTTVLVSSPGTSANQHLQVRPAQRPRAGSNASERPPVAPPLPDPPAPEAPPTGKASPPPTPMARDGHRGARARKLRKTTPINGAVAKAASSTMQASLLDGSVPPINVLIVEDNIINLKLLEAFMKRLKVRWSTAMNGQIAVKKWRAGGFHLVLMDIQLPIMSGLEATKEIRRLERANGIGVFSNSTGTSQGEVGSPAKDRSEDKLKIEGGLFKSPVIIVALTASSLQSDRHEALAAGCNDFLTKASPVNFVWLERKVKEWGCMQALIDFDGWRKWKDFSAAATPAKVNGKSPSPAAIASPAPATPKSPVMEKKAKRDKRVSVDLGGRLPPPENEAGTAAGEAT